MNNKYIYTIISIRYNICNYFLASDLDHHQTAVSTPASIAASHAQASQVNHFTPVPASCHTHHRAVVVVSRTNFGDCFAAVVVIDQPDLSIDQPARGTTMIGLKAALPIVLRGAFVSPLSLRSLSVVSSTSALNVPGALDTIVEI